MRRARLILLLSNLALFAGWIQQVPPPAAASTPGRTATEPALRAVAARLHSLRDSPGCGPHPRVRRCCSGRLWRLAARARTREPRPRTRPGRWRRSGAHPVRTSRSSPGTSTSARARTASRSSSSTSSRADRAPDGAGLARPRAEAEAVRRDDGDARADRRPGRRSGGRPEHLRRDDRDSRSRGSTGSSPSRSAARRSRRSGTSWSGRRRRARRRRARDPVREPDARPRRRSRAPDDRRAARYGAAADDGRGGDGRQAPVRRHVRDAGVLPDPHLRARRPGRPVGREGLAGQGRRLHPHRDLQGQRPGQRDEPVGRRVEPPERAVHVRRRRHRRRPGALEGAFSAAELRRGRRSKVALSHGRRG